jgi:poly(3-hydroxybutyrate) depolymerase
MTQTRLFSAIALGAITISAAGRIARAQGASPPTLEDTIPPGANFDKAEFRFWAPPGAATLRGTMVLVPGSNGDGRAMAEDTVWQAFAARQHLALLACRFTDKPHDQNFIEDYVNVSHGSGQALLDALGHLAARSRHPELASEPLLFWGMSAGGQFNYEFASWKPERVLAFVVNKGGIYYTALTPRATRAIPALLFIGGKDLESRVNTITGLFDLNRRGGALWALAPEPSAAHIVGRSRDMSIMFFDDVLPLRLGGGDEGLRPVAESSGYVGDLHANTVQPMSATAKLPSYPTSWLPTERTARAWLAMATEKPFDP